MAFGRFQRLSSTSVMVQCFYVSHNNTTVAAFVQITKIKNKQQRNAIYNEAKYISTIMGKKYSRKSDEDVSIRI